MNNRQMYNQSIQNRNRYNMRNIQEKRECACTDKSKMYIKNCQCLDDLPLGIAYVPWQKWKKILDTKEGLYKGTIFSELVYPFYGCGYKKGGIN